MASLNPITKGIQFAAYVAALARSKGDPLDAAGFAAGRWSGWPTVAACLKAAVSAGDPNDPTWASPLVNYGLADDFLQALRARTVIDRLDGIRRAPFRTNVPKETGGTSGAWVGPGLPIPLSKSQFETVVIDLFKAGVLVALVGELLKSTTPAALASIKNSLVAGVAEFLDQQFLDPAVAAVAGVSPASITNGATEVTATGSDAAAMKVDLAAMIEAAETMVAPVWIARPLTIARISAELGLPNAKIIGGDLFGIPIIATQSQGTTGSPPAPRYVTLLDQAGVLVADDSIVDVEMSSVTSLQMVDVPVPGAADVISLFQSGGAVAKVVRHIAWMRTRTTGAVYMEVDY